MSYQLIKDLTKVNYTKGNKGRKYIVLHYTGNKTDTANNNAGYFRSINRGASAHYFVDKSTVYQVVGQEDTAWAVGKNYGLRNLFGIVTNSNSLNIEMCSDNGKIADETFANAVILTRELMKKYSVSAENVYRHYDVCSKQCPGWKGWLGSDSSLWQKFKAELGGNSTGDSAVALQSVSEINSVDSKLTVDGVWGKATTKRLQKILGTTQDSIVSNQYAAYKKSNPGLAAGWDWNEKPFQTGSPLIKVIQKTVGTAQDGFIGPVTIKAMQKHWGTVQDGVVSKPSALVIAIQNWANRR